MGYYTDGQQISYEKLDDGRIVRKYENDALVISNATTFSGKTIGIHGGEGNSWINRWLGHDTSKYTDNGYIDTFYTVNENQIITGYSDGCFITTRENQKMLMEHLKNAWLFTNGTQIRGSIINSSYRNYVSNYPNTRGWK